MAAVVVLFGKLFLSRSTPEAPPTKVASTEPLKRLKSENLNGSLKVHRMNNWKAAAKLYNPVGALLKFVYSIGVVSRLLGELVSVKCDFKVPHCEPLWGAESATRITAARCSTLDSHKGFLLTKKLFSELLKIPHAKWPIDCRLPNGSTWTAPLEAVPGRERDNVTGIRLSNDWAHFRLQALIGFCWENPTLRGTMSSFEAHYRQTTSQWASLALQCHCLVRRACVNLRNILKF